jgi:hypothetical protein
MSCRLRLPTTLVVLGLGGAVLLSGCATGPIATDGPYTPAMAPMSQERSGSIRPGHRLDVFFPAGHETHWTCTAEVTAFGSCQLCTHDTRQAEEVQYTDFDSGVLCYRPITVPAGTSLQICGDHLWVRLHRGAAGPASLVPRLGRGHHGRFDAPQAAVS